MEYFISKRRNYISFNLYSSEIYKDKSTNIEHQSPLIFDHKKNKIEENYKSARDIQKIIDFSVS